LGREFAHVLLPGEQELKRLALEAARLKNPEFVRLPVGFAVKHKERLSWTLRERYDRFRSDETIHDNLPYTPQGHLAAPSR
jgi:hypothetical protein